MSSDRHHVSNTQKHIRCETTRLGALYLALRDKFGCRSRARLREQVTDPPVGEDVVNVDEEPLIYNLTVGHEE